MFRAKKCVGLELCYRGEKIRVSVFCENLFNRDDLSDLLHSSHILFRHSSRMLHVGCMYVAQGSTFLELSYWQGTAR